MAALVTSILALAAAAAAAVAATALAIRHSPNSICWCFRSAV